MSKPQKPIGWANTVTSLTDEAKLIWKSVMTVEHSPLKNLDPMVGHMVFQCLFFIWSGIFALMVGSYIAFGLSAAFHLLLISGITITVVTFRQAENNPESLNNLLKSGRKYDGRANGGEHE